MEVGPRERWLEALWPKLRSHLAAPPGVIVELGCGPIGGFVPRLRAAGYEAIGVDPAAPEGSIFRQIEFEAADLPTQLDAVVACTSLHHVADPRQVVEKIANGLAPGGLVVVIEWDWEDFDEETARWCFDRLALDGPEEWLHHRRDGWKASGESWERYLSSWADQHGLHSAPRLLQELDRRFARVTCQRGAYFFPELGGASEEAELEAIDAGQIRPGRIDYVGRAR